MVDIHRFPNMTGLHLYHFEPPPAPAGEKTIMIDFSQLDFELCDDGVPLSFKACSSVDDMGEWYIDRMDNFPIEVIPYVVYKTLYPDDKIPTPKHPIKKVGNFKIDFE
jgi:hypothetical protein